MAKDPAFLFYSNDFLSGTFLMSNEQVGKYIRLLCLQHQKGTLTKKDMLNICQTYDEDIFNKFAVDNKDNYFNIRLKEEFEKRRAYSESRSKNRKSKKDDKLSKSYDEHMENEDEDVNKDEKRKRKFVPPTLIEIKLYFKENGYKEDIAEKAFKGYDVANWIDSKGNKILNWKQKCIHVWFKDEHKVIRKEIELDSNGKPRPSNQHLLIANTDGSKSWVVL